MKNLTVAEFFKQFPNDDKCLDHLFEVRYGQDYKCPKCGRETKWSRLNKVKAFSCQFCGHHLHPMVGTPFERSRTPLQLWFYAIYLFCSTRHGVSAKELERQLGVTYKCAWRMGHEIRKHMAEVDGDDPLSGHVEIDESFFGGKIELNKKNKHWRANKTIVMGMVERGGDIITKVVEDTTADTLLPEVQQNVEQGSKVSTDDFNVYRNLRADYDHGYVAHKREQWKKGEHHTNSIEGYWSHLKKSIASTHIQVSKKHMNKYLKEFEYRFNARQNPASMFPELISSFAPNDQESY